MTIIGNDVSRYQYLFDSTGNITCAWRPEVAANAGSRFFAVRATVGNYYTDASFPRSFRDAQIQAPTTAYHVVTPEYSAGGQMDWLFSTLDIANVVEDYPIVLDCELDRGQTPSRITSVIAACIERVKYETGDYPIIYTAPYWWNANTIYHPLFAQCDLWIANYTTAPTPLLPRDWSTWRFWQYSDRGSGMTYGACSLYIDMNRFNGSEDDFSAYMAAAWIPGSPPPPQEEPLPKLKCKISGLSIRERPDVNAPKIGVLALGEIVEVLEIKTITADNVWVRHAQGWSAFIYYSPGRLLFESL